MNQTYDNQIVDFIASTHHKRKGNTHINMPATQETAHENNKMTTIGFPENHPDRFKLLLLETNRAKRWECINGSGVLVSNENLISECFDLRDDFQLVEYLTDYLARSHFESW